MNAGMQTIMASARPSMCGHRHDASSVIAAAADDQVSGFVPESES
jgi:hypothetical protein